jgi:hypothetical protein
VQPSACLGYKSSPHPNPHPTNILPACCFLAVATATHERHQLCMPACMLYPPCTASCCPPCLYSTFHTATRVVAALRSPQATLGLYRCCRLLLLELYCFLSPVPHRSACTDPHHRPLPLLPCVPAGYIGSLSLLQAVAAVAQELRRANPHLTYGEQEVYTTHM